MTLGTFTLKDWRSPEDEARYTRLAALRPFTPNDLVASALSFVPLSDPAGDPPLRPGEQEVRRETEVSQEELRLAKDWAARPKPD